MKKSNNKEQRKKSIEQAGQILKLWSKNNGNKKINPKMVGAALFAATAGISGLIYGIVKEDEPKVGVVNYVYTNKYKDTENNKIDALEKGRIIKYNKGDITEWEQLDQNGKFEKSLSFIKVKNVLEQSTENLLQQHPENPTEQLVESYNVNNIKDYKSVKDIYTLAQSVDEYVKCNHIDTLNFRNSPSINSESSKIIGKEEKLYVCLSDKTPNGDVEENQYNFKKAILVDEKGNIQQGYVADIYGYISEDVEEKECIGITNDRTFIRDSAKLVEFDGTRIVGEISNGEVVEIVDSSDESFYKCRSVDSNKKGTFFLSKNTVSTDIDFDFNAKFVDNELTPTITYMKVFSNSGELIDFYNKRDGSNYQIAISPDDILKVDGDKSKDGVYNVWNVTKGFVGYIDGDKLIDTETNKTIESIYNPHKSREERVPETTNSESSNSESFEQTNRITGAYYDENKMSIVIDSRYCTKTQLERLINYYKNNNIPVSGVIFSIGATYEDGGFNLAHLKDEDNVYSNYLSDSVTVSIQQTWDQINAEMGRLGRLPLAGEEKSRGNIEELVERIEFVLGNGIPVGLYYYSAEMDEEEVSAAAAYCYGVEKYLNTKSKIYRDSNLKLPFAIDIESSVDCYGNCSVPRECPENTRRAELSQRFAELLGNGIEESKASNYFCIDGCNPKQGYGILNDKVMFYGDIRNNGKNIQDLLGYKYDEMKKNLEEKGYSVYLWGSSQLDNVGIGWERLDSKNIMNNLSDKETYLNSLRNMARLNGNLIPQVAINQAILEAPYEDGSYDISITTNENINKMLEGEKVEVVFEQAVQNSMDVDEHSNSRNNGQNQDFDYWEY